MKARKPKQHEYTAFFATNEHGGYTVTVPAIPGLVAEGEDVEHARTMAKGAIQCFIEGLKNSERAHSSRKRIRAGQVFSGRIGGDPKAPPLQRAQGAAANSKAVPPVAKPSHAAEAEELRRLLDA